MIAGIASLAKNLPGLKRVLNQHITKYNPINLGEESKAMKFDKKYLLGYHPLDTNSLQF